MLILIGKTLSSQSGAFSSPDWSWLKKQINQHIPTLLPKVKKALRRRFNYKQDIAQLIRDGAGVPFAEIVGIPVGIIAGLNDLNALGPAEIGKNFYGGYFAAESSSGSGTENDPWVIENRLFQTCQIRNDNAGWTKFRNCLFENGHNIEILIRDTFIGNIIFESCEFYDAIGSGANAYVIRVDAPNEYRFEKCLFSGATVNQTFGIASSLMLDGSNIKFSFKYCRADESRRVWSNNADFFENIAIPDHSINIDLEIKNCEFDSPSGGGKNIVGTIRPDVYTRLVLENNSVNGFASLLKSYSDTVMTPIQNLSLKNNRVVDTKQECIRCGNIKNGEIAYNDFIHETRGANFRLVFLPWDATTVGSACENVDVHHNKFTKKTGPASVNSECLESAAGINIKFRWNWVTECPEDAFEHLTPHEGCTIEYCVADNCGVQVCDIWKTFDPINNVTVNSNNDNSTIPAAGTHIHHIYGDCGDWPVIISGANGVVVHDIYVNNALADPVRGTIHVQDRDGVVSENIFVAGPLPTADERSYSQAVVFTSTGTNVAGQWVDENGSLITLP